VVSRGAMRRIWATLALLLPACAHDGEDTRSDDQRQRDAFVVPECVVAEGTPVPGTLSDPSGTASVAVTGTGCARSFTLSSTAERRDNVPAGPVTLRESVGAPNIQTTNPLFDALYQLALDEARQNSVAAIRDFAFNDGAEMRCPEGGCFETGRKWNYVWTRDTAYASDLGLGWIDPLRAMNSLAFKLSPRRDGSAPQIVQDTGTGGSYPISTDRAVWALGAREILRHLYGEARTRFRDRAFEAAKNTTEHDRKVVFDGADGLYRGEQSFLDWREQTYPSWTVPDTVHLGMGKALSTNLAHLALIDLVRDLALETGDTATATTMSARASELRRAIARRFWLESDHGLATYTSTELDPSAVRRFDLLGTSLAVLLEAVTPEQARDAIAHYPTLAYGPPVVFPEEQHVAIYHNRAIWPFVTAYWARAARKVRNDAAFDRAVASLVRGAALNLSNMENLEVESGRPWVEEGSTSGPVVSSQRQLWSVAGYVGTIVSGLFGIEAEPGGVRVAPFVTAGLHASLFGAGRASIAINDVPLRGRRISVVLRLPEAAGRGAYRIAGVTLNSVPYRGDVIADADLRERNLVEVELAPGDASSTVPVIESNGNWKKLYAPRTPSIRSLGETAGKLALSFDFGGEDTRDLAYEVYRDGIRIASGPATEGGFVDSDTAGAETPSHCYAVEARFRATGNASHHSAPVCYWGSGNRRVTSVYPDAFEMRGGRFTDEYGRRFYMDWGDPGHSLAAVFNANRTGAHLVQAVYGNGGGPINTGITCAVKHATVIDVASGERRGEGYLRMPQRGAWSSWGDSSFVRADLVAGRRYRVVIDHDDASINMSGFAHFDAYTGGTGGRSGPFYRVNIAELKLLAR
jgi:hypothetical protein